MQRVEQAMSRMVARPLAVLSRHDREQSLMLNVMSGGLRHVERLLHRHADLMPLDNDVIGLRRWAQRSAERMSESPGKGEKKKKQEPAHRSVLNRADDLLLSGSLLARSKEAQDGDGERRDDGLRPS